MKLNEWLCIETENSDIEQYEQDIFIGSDAIMEAKTMISDAITKQYERTNEKDKNRFWVEVDGGIRYNWDHYKFNRKEILEAAIFYGQIDCGPLTIHVYGKGNYVS